MESFWYLPNLIALLGVIVVLIWQSTHTTDYERRRAESCEDELDKLRLENERLQLLVMGGNRVVIGAGAHVGQVAAGEGHSQENSG